MEVIMKHQRTVTFLVSLILIIAAVTAGILVVNNRNTQTAEITLYYLNKDGTSFEAVRSGVHFKEAAELPAKAANLLISESGVKYSAIAQSGTELNSIKYVNETDVEVDFSSEFVTEDASRNVLAAYAVIKTLTELDGIERVKVTADGEAITALDGTTLDFMSGGEINSSGELGSGAFFSTIYYPTTESGYLAAECEIRTTGSETSEQYVLRRLLNDDPPKGAYSPTKGGGSLISVTTTDGICYVNFTEDFYTKNKSDTESEHILLYSIVKTLTELDGVDAVQFLSDGKKIQSFGGCDLTKPLYEE